MSGDGKIPLPSGGVSGDHVYEKVIVAQAKIRDLEREVKAFEKDRRELLEEYTDLLNARPVHKSPPPRTSPKVDSLRISAGDVHGMMQDPKAVAVFLADVKALQPDCVVLGGDIMECGGWLAKHQPIGFVALCDYSYQEDCLAANDFLDRLQEAVPEAEIHYIEGNHEDRVERWIVDVTRAHARDAEFLRRAFAPEFMLRLAERGITYYRRTEVYGEGLPRGWIKLGKMFFTHSLSYSKNAARDAASRTAGNITYFCTHREDAATVVFPAVGIVKAFNPGCLCSMQPVWKNSTPTSWSQGYAIDFIAPSGEFQRVHVPIWRGKSLAASMIERFKS